MSHDTKTATADKSKDRNQRRKQKAITVLAWIFVGLGFLAAIYGLWVTARAPEGFNLPNLSSFGSFAQGAVASLWSLGALFFLYATLLAQERQINQQESQLEQQRIQYEAEQQRQQFENEQQEKQVQLQQQASQLQSFENSFFQMLNLLNEVSRRLTADYEPLMGERAAGEAPDCLRRCKNLLTSHFQGTHLQLVSEAAGPDRQTVEHAAQEYYLRFYANYRAALDHYFRVLYHIIKFVDTSQALAADSERKRYTSLVRAQLSGTELFLIFYNGLCPHAAKFRPLIEKYGLLEHLDKSLLLHESHAQFYERAYD